MKLEMPHCGGAAATAFPCSEFTREGKQHNYYYTTTRTFSSSLPRSPPLFPPWQPERAPFFSPLTGQREKITKGRKRERNTEGEKVCRKKEERKEEGVSINPLNFTEIKLGWHCCCCCWSCRNRREGEAERKKTVEAFFLFPPFKLFFLVFSLRFGESSSFFLSGSS